MRSFALIVLLSLLCGCTKEQQMWIQHPILVSQILQQEKESERLWRLALKQHTYRFNGQDNYQYCGCKNRQFMDYGMLYERGENPRYPNGWPYWYCAECKKHITLEGPFWAPFEKGDWIQIDISERHRIKSNWEKIELGMTLQQVEQILGAPWQKRVGTYFAHYDYEIGHIDFSRDFKTKQIGVSYIKYPGEIMYSQPQAIRLDGYKIVIE